MVKIGDDDFHEIEEDMEQAKDCAQMQEAVNGRTNPSYHNYGIDLLRECSMLMICIVHILQQGGILAASPRMGAHYIIARFLEALVICGVNCFALISGYIKSTSTIRFKSLFTLWCEVVFYSFFIGLLFWLISPKEVPARDVIENLFPVSMLRYWYFSAYVFLFLMMPILNVVICKMPMKDLRNALFSIFIIVCLFRCLPMLNKIGREFKEGFSSIWLMYLYLVGGYIRKYGLRQLLDFGPFTSAIEHFLQGRVRRDWLPLIAFFFCAALSWGISLVAEFINMRYLHRDFHFSFLTLYISPTIFMASIMLLHYFTHLELNRFKGMASSLAPMAFSVYLIQTQHEIWKFWFKGGFTWMIRFPAWSMPILTVVSAISMFLICSMVDYVRIRLFKILRIR